MRLVPTVAYELAQKKHPPFRVSAFLGVVLASNYRSLARRRTPMRLIQICAIPQTRFCEPSLE